MVKRKKLKLSDVVDSINSQPIESPYGDVRSEPKKDVRKKLRDALINLQTKEIKEVEEAFKGLESEDSDYDLGTVRKKRKKKVKKKTREVIMFPEKTNSESPKTSKLKKASREVEAMQGKLSNIVRVPKEQLDTFMQIYNNSSKDISSEFLSSIAPVFLAYEDAMNYSTVALRDGLSYDGEIDLELAPLLEWSARLNTFEIFLSKLTSLSEATKERLVRLATNKAVEKAFMSKGQGVGLNSTHNKVAGIVTTLNTETEKNKVKKAINTVTQLKSASKIAREGSKSPSMVGAILKKKLRTRQ